MLAPTSMSAPTSIYALCISPWHDDDNDDDGDGASKQEVY